jgi:hypothetical protein
MPPQPCEAVREVGASGRRPESFYDDDFAAALPPLRPAAFFWAVVPPCFELPPDPDFFPPREDAPGELAILAARSLDIPLSLRASYCFSFFTLGRLPGIGQPPRDPWSPRSFPQSPLPMLPDPRAASHHRRSAARAEPPGARVPFLEPGDRHTAGAYRAPRAVTP